MKNTITVESLVDYAQKQLDLFYRVKKYAMADPEIDAMPAWQAVLNTLGILDVLTDDDYEIDHVNHKIVKR